MDFTPLLKQFLSIVWYLVPLFILVCIVKSRWFKGVLGEFQVNLCLKLFLPKNAYHLIKNVTLPTSDGTAQNAKTQIEGTTQIDHIVVSVYGVFVIETKNMKGWIFGSAEQKQWTQRIFKHSSRFQNPLHQNYKHVKTLEACLNLPMDSIFSVVAFVGDSVFKTPMPENVTYAGGLVRYIKAKETEIFSQEQVADIIEKIESERFERGIRTNLKHVAHVKKIIEAKEKPSQASGCPKCGSAMVVREVKKGAKAGNKFWGCSSFPKCRVVAEFV